MAVLKSTLSNSPNTYVYRVGAAGSSQYPVPRPANPYRPYGARVNYGQDQQSPDRYGGLLQIQQLQTQRQIPSTVYSANYEADPILARLAALRDQTIANARLEASGL